jgi:hypothetical protein
MAVLKVNHLTGLGPHTPDIPQISRTGSSVASARKGARVEGGYTRPPLRPALRERADPGPRDPDPDPMPVGVRDFRSGLALQVDGSFAAETVPSRGDVTASRSPAATVTGSRDGPH